MPHPLPCHVEVPDAFAPKARYALRMLLAPLGLAPRWTDAAGLTDGGVYYGPDAEAQPAPVVALPLHESTLAYFADGPQPYESDDVRWVEWEGARWPVLFGTEDASDLVASAFFWLSGWQEHATPRRDRFGRFPFEASLQAALGTATRPAVDAYRQMLAERLDAAGMPVEPRTWAGRSWAVCPTFDVDYLRKWRPGMIYREGMHYLVQNHRREPLPARLRRFSRFLADWLTPGDACRQALDGIHAELRRRGATGTVFVKTGAHGPHDVAYDPANRYLRRRLAAMEADGIEVGLHPSFHAHTHPAYLREERARLAALTEASPASVRQHYLRYEPSVTSRLHAEAGFRHDSTLGFAETEGFRHATCHPFQVYDVLADAPLGVWEWPLAVMEAVLFNRRHLGVEAAVAATKEVLAACRRFGGVAVLLWHNTLWDELDYPGWAQHFLATLDAADAEGAAVTSIRAAAAELG